MEVTQTDQEKTGRRWHFYLISSLSFLLTVLLAVGVAYFWEEVQSARGYGYAGGFLVSVMGGITIIPVPSLLVIFTLGRVLDPLYVGLVSGLGEALGGITVYLTGAGVETMWSRLRSGESSAEYRSDTDASVAGYIDSKFWTRGLTFYNRLLKWAGGRSSYWMVFIASALIISPFYFAALAAGTLRIGLIRFFLISWAGKTVRGLTIAYAGYWGIHLILRWGGT